MNMYDIVTKKKCGGQLSKEEIDFFTLGYTSSQIPDYQISALLMAICLNGMTDEETKQLSLSIAKSGDVIDLSDFGELSVDKHSTGGVGDKTTLIVSPIVASVGGVVAKMSGRGLGHTGGTLDKLESIPGYRINLPKNDFYTQVKEIGIAVIGQSANLAPADKKLYALRDVTATVDSIPLITSSVMGKKIAAGSKSIVLDVKCGSGAFMKDKESATRLAKLMVDIGKSANRNVSAIITDMDVPLGYTIGNALEVIEAIEVLKGTVKNDLSEVSVILATEMVSLSLSISKEEARQRCEQALSSGMAYKKFCQWVSVQGGDLKYINEPSLLMTASKTGELKAKQNGYISKMDTEKFGMASVLLGAGRLTKEDSIDFSAGIVLQKKVGDYVNADEVIATLYSQSNEKLKDAVSMLSLAVEYCERRIERKSPVIDILR